MPYCMCWRQLLMVWIYYCVSMGCGFHFYKVNLFIAAYHRIKVSVKKKKSQKNII